MELASFGVGRSRSARSGSVAASAFATPLSADAFEYSLVMELAMRSASRAAARSGSVAASASATSLSADAFEDSLVMELAMRSARSGSVAASASAMSLSADAFEDSSVMELAMRSARSGSVAASAFAMPLSADAFQYSSVMELAMRSARSGVGGGCQRRRDAAQRQCLRELVGDGVGDAFGVGRSRAARSGSVAASASATPLSADAFDGLVGDGVGDAFGAVRGRWLPAPARRRSAPDAFEDSLVMELAMRSARSGSVAASAFATSLSADAFEDSLVMELAMRSAR